MNSVILIGRLTRDPEIRYTAGSQMAIAKFSIAVDRPVRAGKEREADFPRITVFGKQAENCERFLAKGRLVGIQGRLQTGSYQDRDGKTVYTTDVVADRVEFLEWGDRANGGNAPKQSQGYHNQNSGSGYNNNGGSFGGYSNAPADDFEDEMPDSFQAIDEDVPF
ncbi:MAG: single-stranded DNA-binding protein [Firmicutes bacterium]|nr:single-stranded DNA-binding protein [Bacillota bacterium]MBQ6662304.1 single-stranded DNA-binding protein [Bacillota bacterium]MCR4712550.1 single-stranded DNA-binding protein [Clostridia bacterium]